MDRLLLVSGLTNECACLVTTSKCMSSWELGNSKKRSNSKHLFFYLFWLNPKAWWMLKERLHETKLWQRSSHLSCHLDITFVVLLSYFFPRHEGMPALMCPYTCHCPQSAECNLIVCFICSKDASLTVPFNPFLLYSIILNRYTNKVLF